MNLAEAIFGSISLQSGTGLLGIGAAVILLLLAAGTAFVLFIVLKRSVKMAVRLIIVGVIILAALIGTGGLLYLSFTDRSAPAARPPANRSR